MGQLIKALRFLFDHLEESIVIVCMAGISILTFIAVVTRYLLNIPIAGAEEVASFMFTWAALFGAATAFKYNQHGSVPLLANRLSPRARRVADLVVLACMAGFFAFLSFYTWQFLGQSYRVGQTSPATGIPAWIVNAGIFLALALCGVRCAIAFVRDVTGRPRYDSIAGKPNA